VRCSQGVKHVACFHSGMVLEKNKRAGATMMRASLEHLASCLLTALSSRSRLHPCGALTRTRPECNSSTSRAGFMLKQCERDDCYAAASALRT